MGRLIITEFLSLDGVMEDPGGAEGFKHGGWSFKFNDPEGMQFKLDETLGSDALLLGRVTYEGFAAAWPGRTDDVGFAEKMNAMPKYVVSSTLTDPAWGPATILSGDLVRSAQRVKDEVDGTIAVHGSATLAQGLLAAGLADELRLMVHPIVLGSGRRLFTDAADAMTLSLIDSRKLGSGSVILTYGPAD